MKGPDMDVRIRHAGIRHEGLSEESLRDLVERFYAKVRSDALIGPVFNQAIADWPEHLDKLQAFWSSVMLTSGRYKGRPLPAHIKHADRIDHRSFERWLAIWKETTEELLDGGSAAALQDKAERIAESLQLGIELDQDRQAALGLFVDTHSREEGAGPGRVVPRGVPGS